MVITGKSMSNYEFSVFQPTPPKQERLIIFVSSKNLDHQSTGELQKSSGDFCIDCYGLFGCSKDKNIKKFGDLSFHVGGLESIFVVSPDFRATAQNGTESRVANFFRAILANIGPLHWSQLKCAAREEILSSNSLKHRRVRSNWICWNIACWKHGKKP